MMARWVEGTGVEPMAGEDFRQRGTVRGSSADGRIAVGWLVHPDAQPTQAAIWSGRARAEVLKDAEGAAVRPGARNWKMGVTATGSRLVGSLAGPEDRPVAFIWDRDRGARPLAEVLQENGIETPGWTLTAASSISSDGTVVVGTGTNPQGEEDAWRAVIGAPPARPPP